MLYTIKLPTGLRIGVCLHEVTAVEEVVSEGEPTPGGVLPVKKQYIRLFLRNGSSFTVEDRDREMYDRIRALLKFGDHDQQYDEGESDAAS